MLYGICHETPEPVQKRRLDVPPDLARVVQRSLAKTPAARYASAEARRADLRAVAEGIPESETRAKGERAERSLGARTVARPQTSEPRQTMTIRRSPAAASAVLSSRSPCYRWRAFRATPQEYLADGITDELISTLGQIAALRVISRTSVMPYKERKRSGARSS